MTGYRSGSGWNDLNELRCLQACMQIKEAELPNGMHTKLAKNIAAQSGLGVGSVKAKINNYKSLAGDTGDSHASRSTRDIYSEYGDLSATELEKLVQEWEKST